MRTSYSTFVIISLFVTFVCCRNNRTVKYADDINFKDTLYQTHVSLASNGDSVFEYDTIYFTPTDLSVDTSGFFYQASAIPWAENKTYKIFFPRQKVIAFCDSVLQTFPPNPNNELDDYFDARLLYETLKDEAVNNKTNEVIFGDELSTLLERFKPLIINQITGDKPTYMIVTKQGYTGEMKLYQIRTQAGDTIMLTATMIRPIEFEDEK